MCTEVLPLTHFYRHKSRPDGLEARCKTCTDIRRRYHITNEELASLVVTAFGMCDSCGTEFKSSRDAHIDHCHDTMNIRGLLCSGCNTSLGKFNDDPDHIFKLIKYVIRTEHAPFFKSDDLHLSKTYNKE